MGAITKALNRVKFINDAGDYEDVVARLVSLYGSASGIAVTDAVALSIPAVYNCVRIIAEDVAKLPLHLYLASDNDRDKKIDDPLYRLLHDFPNPCMTAQEYRETCMAHVLLRGNSYSQIIRDNRGNPVELWPLNPKRMQVKLVDDGKNVRLLYVYTALNNDEMVPGDKSVKTVQRPFEESEIFHLRGLSSNGIIGYSPITVFRDSLGLAKAQEQYAEFFFRNNATPDMMLKHPSGLSDRAYNRLKEHFAKEHQGVENAGGFGILEEGMDIVKIGLSNEDSQFLQSREFSMVEIAQMFRMQLHKLMMLKTPTFASVEMFAIEYVMDTLTPWLERWEQRLNLSLLGKKRVVDGWYFEHDVNGLLRGDIKSRFEAYNMGRNGGWYSRNDIRRMENMNPIPNGDDYLTPVNMQPINA